MKNDYFKHPDRFPKNAPGPFYTLGYKYENGAWCGQCLSCGIPETEAPSLLAPLTDENSDTYFVRQPETDDELEQACSAIEVCCVDALRYGGRDPKTLARLHQTGCCDYTLQQQGLATSVKSSLDSPSISPISTRKWWEVWK
jgi:hypothetical protein